MDFNSIILPFFLVIATATACDVAADTQQKKKSSQNVHTYFYDRFSISERTGFMVLFRVLMTKAIAILKKKWRTLY